MTVQTLTLGEHVAHLDPIIGQGLLVLPCPSTDVHLRGGESLHAADFNSAMRALNAVGFELTTAEDGGWVGEDDPSGRGRTMLGLYGREPIQRNARVEEFADSTAALVRAALAGG